MKKIIFLLLLASNISFAQMSHESSSMNHEPVDHQMMVDNRKSWGPDFCEDDEVWDYSQGMCNPLNRSGKEKKLIMVHGNAFLTGIWAEKPRGKDQFAIPNMIMGNIGKTFGERHFLNANVMLTFEKWTFPKDGYSELLQIGERNEDDIPYVDAQHPHSSPIMGLTLSDTYYVGEEKDHIKLFFAPRGQATDGPIAFMHRPTGMTNPDAPLGHHLAQDIGHITSTVLGASITKGKTTFEFSTFNGREPEPAKVDLPIGSLNSYGARLSQDLGDNWFAMLSAAYIKDPEGDHAPQIDHNWRYSFSTYFQKNLAHEWTWSNTIAYGLINFYDGISKLQSLNEEFLFYKKPYNIWGRIEYVQRASAELSIADSEPLQPRDVYAVTFGYTHDLPKLKSLSVGLGGSLTKVFLPSTFRDAYGSDPISGRIFIQITGMWMPM
jgi:hypothetical protein